MSDTNFHHYYLKDCRSIWGTTLPLSLTVTLWEDYYTEFYSHFFPFEKFYEFLERLGYEWAFVLSGAWWFFNWECLVNPLTEHTSALYLMHGGGTKPYAAQIILWQASLKSPLLKAASLNSCTYSLCCDQPLVSFFTVAWPPQHKCRHPMNANEKHIIWWIKTRKIRILSSTFTDTSSWLNCLHVPFTLGTVLSGAIASDRFSQEKLKGQMIHRHQ